MSRIIKSIKVFLAYVILIIRNMIYKPFKIKNIDESIDEILANEKSLIRFGDGEIALIHGFNLRFQECSAEIQDDLIRVLSSNKQNVLIAVPDNMTIKALKQYRKAEREAWVKESVHSYMTYIKYCKNDYYLTSLVSRLYLPFNVDYNIATARFDKIKRLWDKRNLLIVEGEFSRLGVGNDLLKNASSIHRILCPPKNAYSRVKFIEERIMHFNSIYKYDLVLLALGPTSKVIAYDLADMIRIIDIGHIDIEYEWYLKKAIDKISIEGKAVNEAEDGYDNLDITNEIYDSEIIEVIK